MSAWRWLGLGLLFACAAAAAAPETPAPLHFATGTSFRKTTLEDCALRGGEYLAAPGLKADDLVDCLAPHKVRDLGLPAPGPREVLASIYDYLYRPAIERPGYALYSYLLLPGEGARGERLLREIFSTTSFVGLDGVRPDQLNIVYLPTRAAEIRRLLPIVSTGTAPSAADFSRKFYDYVLARALLTRICAAVTEKTQAVCGGDLSLGPYIFTFLQPVTGLEKMPAPFLLLDLSNVHERAFGEFVAAYKEQVRQPQFSDRRRIDTFRLRILSVVLTSADWLKPLVGDTANAATVIE
ncbi:MAG TPA: hypothetical protein VJQ52_04230 [Steroidobacteraceae bacterium]|nr:hypothetical protein [Steroidobacteraceae bacterium]